MVRTETLVVLMLAAAWSAAGEEVELKADFLGSTFRINGNATKLNDGNWAEPDKTWRTVGEMLKTAVPPANEDGQRPGVVLVSGVDDATPWGGLKSLLMASAGLGLQKARIAVPGKPNAEVALPLPGADPSQGEVVKFPLFAGPQGVQTENGGKRLNVSHGLLQGLVKQMPKATVYVEAAPEMKAVAVLGVLRMLHQDVKPGAVAFLPVTDCTPEEAAKRKDAKEAVDRAFEGGLGGLGK